MFTLPLTFELMSFIESFRLEKTLKIIESNRSLDCHPGLGERFNPCACCSTEAFWLPNNPLKELRGFIHYFPPT